MGIPLQDRSSKARFILKRFIKSPFFIAQSKHNGFSITMENERMFVVTHILDKGSVRTEIQKFIVGIER
jgi:hypothetical protein